MPMPGQDSTHTPEPSASTILPRLPTAGRDQLAFPPIRNGIDYLVSVVDHLTADEVSDRDIKYAVLHLQAAAEVLLKVRLVLVHWSLVFDDPGKASEKAFQSAAFKSCTVTDAVTRLCNIAGVEITTKQQKALQELARDRNALQHYGLTLDTSGLEARAGRVLDFLVSFLDDILLPELEQDEKNTVGAEMVHIRDGLENIHTYIKERMQRLRGELSGLEERTIACPTCGQLALIADGTQNRCLFCGTTFLTASWLIQMWLDEPTRQCPRCRYSTVVMDVTVASEADPVPFCFSCPGIVPPADVQPAATTEGEPQ
ncbi:hypothetical protein [Streptomyces sp. NPDC002491]